MRRTQLGPEDKGSDCSLRMRDFRKVILLPPLLAGWPRLPLWATGAAQPEEVCTEVIVIAHEPLVPRNTGRLQSEPTCGTLRRLGVPQGGTLHSVASETWPLTLFDGSGEMSEFYPMVSTPQTQLPPFPVIEQMSDEMVVAMRAMTINEKLQLVAKINREVRRRVASSIRMHNPHWSEEEVHAELIRTMLTAT